MSTSANRKMSTYGVMPGTLGEAYTQMHHYWNQNATMMTLPAWEMLPLPTEVATELERLANLPANWDGNSVAALDPTMVERTRLVLGYAFRFGGSYLPIPFMSPSREGHMILEWETEPNRELIIDVPEYPEQRIRFLLVEPNKEGEETEIESEISDEWAIQGIVRRLVANRQAGNTLAPAVTGGSSHTSDS